MRHSLFPFSYEWILYKSVKGNIKTVLDLGCSDGSLMKGLQNRNNWSVTGIDNFSNSVKKARMSGVYNKVYKGDVFKLNKVILRNKYDLVFSSQVIEHATKKEALRSIKKWEKLAKKQIVITTTMGFFDYLPIEGYVDENPLQKHKSAWYPKDFLDRGYKVNGQGISFLYRENSISRKLKFRPHVFWVLLGYLFSPLTYYFPKYATYIVAKKNL